MSALIRQFWVVELSEGGLKQLYQSTAGIEALRVGGVNYDTADRGDQLLGGHSGCNGLVVRFLFVFPRIVLVAVSEETQIYQASSKMKEDMIQ